MTQQSPPPRHRILVVDDDLRLRDLLKRYLTEQGFAADTVPDGVALDRAAARTRYDLIVLDVMLPNEDGFAICRRLRAHARVYGHATRNLGMTPSAYRAGGEGSAITHAYRNTALGPLLMAATDRGVCFAQFGKSETALVEQLRREFSKAQLVVSNMSNSPELDAWIGAFEAHIAGTAPRPEDDRRCA